MWVCADSWFANRDLDDANHASTCDNGHDTGHVLILGLPIATVMMPTMRAYNIRICIYIHILIERCIVSVRRFIKKGASGQ